MALASGYPPFGGITEMRKIIGSENHLAGLPPPMEVGLKALIYFEYHDIRYVG